MRLIAEMAPYVSIRPARPADGEEIAALHVRSYHETYQDLLPQAHLDAMTLKRRLAAWRQILAERRPPAHVFVAAARGGGLLGFVSGGALRETDDAQGYLPAEIYALYLLAAHQKMGIGRALFTASANYLTMHGHDSLGIRALAHNPATGFYAHLGGRKGETAPSSWLGKGLKEVVYRWRLPLGPF